MVDAGCTSNIHDKRHDAHGDARRFVRRTSRGLLLLAEPDVLLRSAITQMLHEESFSVIALRDRTEAVAGFGQSCWRETMPAVCGILCSSRLLRFSAVIIALRDAAAAAPLVVLQHEGTAELLEDARRRGLAPAVSQAKNIENLRAMARALFQRR